MSGLNEIKSLSEELARSMKKYSEQINRIELNTDNLSSLERSEYNRIRALSEDAEYMSRKLDKLQQPRKQGKLVLRDDGRFALQDFVDDYYFTCGCYMELLRGNEPEEQYWLFGSVEYNHHPTEKLAEGYYFKNGVTNINLKEDMLAATREG